MAGVYAALGLQACLRLWPGMQLSLVHGVVLGVSAVILFFFRKPLLRKYGKPRTRLGDRHQGDSS
jgi:hypothetical protein